MTTRPTTRRALTALATLMAAIALSATPASAQSLKSWERHNKSAFCGWEHKINKLGSEAHPSLNALEKDLEGFYAWGEKHAPPGPDHQPFLQMMSDIGQGTTAIKAGNEQAFETAMNSGQNTADNMPQFIAGSC
jgi:hypothetical protein